MSRSARLGTASTRSSSGSPSSRTRSLATPPSLKKITTTKKMINKPKSNQTQPASAPQAPPAPITAKRRSSAEERARRKGRRPKFQDNPPAPEIVEKKEALQLLEETSRLQADEEELTEEMLEDSEEEEVDDDEDAAVQAAAAQEATNGVKHLETSTENGIKRKLEDDFDAAKKARLEIDQHQTSDPNGQDQELLNGSNSVTSVTLCKQLKEAVKDLDLESLKIGLISKLKSILNEKEVKLDNPNEVFSGMLENQFCKIDDKEAMVTELVNTYLQFQDQGVELESEELKSEIESLNSEEGESTEAESLPPDLLPQVDGVDSSDGQQKDDKETSEIENELKNENIDDNSESQCDQVKTVNNHKQCDKSKILSEMENKFAKETQNALKNKPTYRKKSKSETWELTNGANNGNDHSEETAKSLLIKEPGELEVAELDENTPMISPSSSTTLKSLRKFRKGKYEDHEDGPPVITTSMASPTKSSRMTMSPPPLTPEMPTPLRIDIPDHYTPSPLSSSYSSGYNRRLVIRTPPAARAGLVTMVSEAVLSKEDAEVAATAVQLSPIVIPISMASAKPSSSSNEDHPSLKIRLPKVVQNPIPEPLPTVATTTPHHKKVPKRRNLHPAVESDGGMDTEEDEELKKVQKKPQKHLEVEEKTDEEMEGGKTTPDSQITSDDR